MTIPFIDLKSQYRLLRPDIDRRIDEVLEHGQYIMGPEVQELEDVLAKFTGARECVTVASGTEAILISLMALGIKPGDEVITTPFTFVATAEMIVLLGAKPVFVDIESDTCNVNPALIEGAITSKTAAIMPVSLYGQPADMAQINEIAEKYNIPVIEDAAQSFGATYRQKTSCNLSTLGCTSFFPSKPLGCFGDGGAIFTNDSKLAMACREIRVHGQSERYRHSRLGVGGRMDTIQCAVVLAKMERFPWEIEMRQRIGRRYNEMFDAAKIERVHQRADRTSVFGQYTIKTNQRESLRQKLNEVGIPTAVHYPTPLNEQPFYAKFCCPGCTPISKKVSAEVVSLPMSAFLSEEDQERICRVVIENIC